MINLIERLKQSPVVPIIIPGVSFHSNEEAIEVAKALKKGGVFILEILMRGDDQQQQLAADAIRAIRNDSDTNDVIICAGTINHSQKMRLAVEAGANFMVSADAQAEIIKHWQQHYSETIYAPTAFTTTEVANLLEITSLVKLFPANQFAQKEKYLDSLTGIYGQKGSLLLSYDVTEPANIIDLQHSIVAGIAAAWMTPATCIRDKQWDIITEITALTLVAADQARNKKFLDLKETINKLCKLANIEPAQKEQNTQTDEISNSRFNFFSYLARRPNTDSQSTQNCCIM